MKYRKHFAYYSAGNIMDSWVCICDRTSNHMDTRPGAQPEEPTLFEMDGENALR